MLDVKEDTETLESIMLLQDIINAKNEKIKRLKKERDFWKKKTRSELEGSFYSKNRVNGIMRELEKELK